MIRLGLCGWPEESASESKANRDDEAKDSESIAISFVRSVISFVRKRRSSKAIETYEQVKFLVEYVEHLRSYSKTVEL